MHSCLHSCHLSFCVVFLDWLSSPCYVQTRADTGGGTGISECLDRWSTASGRTWRLGVSMNVTLTPLEVATAEAAVRRKRSMQVALFTPRASLTTHARADAAVARDTGQVDACRSICMRIFQPSPSPSRPDSCTETSAMASEHESACEQACMRTSHPDPHMQPAAKQSKEAGQGGGSAKMALEHTQGKGRGSTKVPLPWYPSSPGILDQTKAPLKHLSWVCRTLQT